ncbi:NADPH:quinone reductase-like Zn-dependent oxidoreductase [Curtobacterium sp. PhB42]|uniref:NADP-dependent oxidoreductase n=1 Tax=unclassified Curtobacterium TaxID=257496 RepID=UPI001063951C|nr:MULTISPECIES: NADP-dependent oxidoreductase [unclassified Curtobacterium]TDW42387.1 NADPH:quinone reductase-like Zn-dependent oxidoreductase [Curtobacterium sp. PhB42]TDW52913.1 NADPH:quinone reductase-like Zn-dependent oxidoreductase [Curtobacterium sp. PhB190]
MQVVGVEQFGGPEALAVHEVPEPHAGAGSVRIRVQAFAVNPTDTGVRAGERDSSQASPPYVPGMDAAGVIDEVGPDVTGWEVGDEVMAIALPLSAHGGAYVQELVAPVGSFTRVPRGTSVALASTVPMNGLTALQILSLAGLSRGDTLAVTGAAGLLGNYVVQLAVAAGLTVIADAAPADEALVRSLGPAHIVPRGDGFAAAVRALVPDGVDALADAAVQRGVVVDAVRDGGVFLDVRGWSGDDSRGIRFEQVAVFSEYRSFDKLEQLRHAVEGGTVVPRVAEVLPASRAAEAHERLEAGGTRGRFVLTW